MEEILAYLELYFIKGLGAVSIKRLIEHYSDASNVLNADFNDLKENFGENIAKLITNRDFTLKEMALKELEKAEKLGVKIIPISSSEYPFLLKNIPDPPSVIYVKGNFPIPENTLAVVGSRKHSNYGVYIVNSIVRELAKSCVNIVSGMALGIDTLAHKVALEEGSFTTAVLGSGIDVIYPFENKKLYEMILEKGCIISEFPFGTKPSSYTFPQRNRIIAGLSYGVFIVEAPDKSGSLITANYANDYGRLVFTAPANINLSTAKGNNTLIKEGAVAITDFEDLKEFLPFLNPSISVDYLSDLKEEEKEVLMFLDAKKYYDEILERFSEKYPDIDAILFNLQLKNLIQSDSMFYYRVV
ncbi:DNA-processing protein DprA [Sulfurihydrogenibium subterraneum]|uniref:DNA-processing protein DprA n=1 Tax=Sulfurihydrogenibium subterraneum TaxID=171121 RepID=UPI000490CBFE|nr:DNA-processing protein DprA [Sulfurihydrogenibium subterraneum]